MPTERDKGKSRQLAFEFLELRLLLTVMIGEKQSPLEANKSPTPPVSAVIGSLLPIVLSNPATKNSSTPACQSHFCALETGSQNGSSPDSNTAAPNPPAPKTEPDAAQGDNILQQQDHVEAALKGPLYDSSVSGHPGILDDVVLGYDQAISDWPKDGAELATLLVSDEIASVAEAILGSDQALSDSPQRHAELATELGPKEIVSVDEAVLGSDHAFSDSPQRHADLATEPGSEEIVSVDEAVLGSDHAFSDSPHRRAELATELGSEDIVSVDEAVLGFDQAFSDSPLDGVDLATEPGPEERVSVDEVVLGFDQVSYLPQDGAELATDAVRTEIVSVYGAVLSADRTALVPATAIVSCSENDSRFKYLETFVLIVAAGAVLLPLCRGHAKGLYCVSLTHSIHN